MDWIRTIRDFYRLGYWTKDQVKEAVRFGKITPEKYEEIVGEPYVN